MKNIELFMNCIPLITPNGLIAVLTAICISGCTSLNLTMPPTIVGDPVSDCKINALTQSQLKLLTFPQNLSYNQAQDVCWGIGGGVAEVHTAHLNRCAIKLLNAADFSPQTYAGAIINLTDTGSEGRWRWGSGQPVTYSNWPMSEPNGARLSNCAGIELARGGHLDGWWNDISCMGGDDAYPAVFCRLIETQQYMQCE